MKLFCVISAAKAIGGTFFIIIGLFVNTVTPASKIEENKGLTLPSNIRICRVPNGTVKLQFDCGAVFKNKL